MRRLVLLGATALVAGCAASAALAHSSKSLDGSKPGSPGKKDTACAGPLGPITISGNLYVPSGASCQLNGTQVTGDVTVYPAASLATSSAYVKHDVLCAQASCQLDSSQIGHDATTLAGATLSVTSSTIGGKLECEDNGDCDVEQSAVGNQVDVDAGAFLVANSATIGGSVKCDRCTDAQLFNSSIKGSVKSSGQANPGLVCNNTIGGSVHFTQDGAGFLTCGGNVIRGSLHVTKDGGYIEIIGNTVGGSLHVSFDTAVQILIFENHVRGALVCKDDTPPPVSFANTAAHISPACDEILL